MADKDLEKKEQDTSRKADSGGNMGAGKSGKEDMGSEKPSDDPGLGSQKPAHPGKERDQGARRTAENPKRSEPASD